MAERKSIAASARAYFDFAMRTIAAATGIYCRRPGFPAITGKSKWARMLAPDVNLMPGAVIVRSDAGTQGAVCVGETEKLSADAYTQAGLASYGTLADKAKRIVPAATP